MKTQPRSQAPLPWGPDPAIFSLPQSRCPCPPGHPPCPGRGPGLQAGQRCPQAPGAPCVPAATPAWGHVTGTWHHHSFPALLGAPCPCCQVLGAGGVRRGPCLSPGQGRSSRPAAERWPSARGVGRGHRGSPAPCPCRVMLPRPPRGPAPFLPPDRPVPSPGLLARCWPGPCPWGWGTGPPRRSRTLGDPNYVSHSTLQGEPPPPAALRDRVTLPNRLRRGEPRRRAPQRGAGAARVSGGAGPAGGGGAGTGSAVPRGCGVWDRLRQSLPRPAPCLSFPKPGHREERAPRTRPSGPGGGGG